MALGQGLIEQLKKAQELVKDPTPLLQRGLNPPPGYTSPNVIDKRSVTPTPRAWRYEDEIVPGVAYDDLTPLPLVNNAASNWAQSNTIERMRDSKPIVPLDRAVPAWADEDRITYQRAVQTMKDAIAPLVRNPITGPGTQAIHENAAQGQRDREFYAQQGQGQYANPATQSYAKTLQQQDPNYSVDNSFKSIYRGLRANVPYADRVQEQAGRAGRYFGEEIVPGALVPGGPAVAWALKKIPGADRVTAIPGRAYEEVFKALVPTEVWDTALTLLPAAKAKSVPELLSAITLGDTDALTAIKSAGRKLGKVAEVDGLLEVLAREAGGPGKTPDDLIGAGVRAGEDALPAASVADVSALPPSPVTGELVPPENSKLASVLREYGSIDPATREAMLKAGRRSQVGQSSAAVQRAIEAGASPKDALEAGRRGMAGQILPDMPNLTPFFEPDEISSYYRQILNAEQSGRIDRYKANTATDALNLMFDGARGNGRTAAIMKREKEILGEVLGPEIAAALPDTPQKLKLWQIALAPFHLWRSMTTGFEISALGRQGRKAMFSDFGEWKASILPSLKSLFSEKQYQRVEDVVKNAEFYDLGQGAERRLGILERGTGDAEDWMSPFIKDNRVLRAVFGPWERQYHGFLNVLRQGMFDTQMRALIKEYNGLENVPQSAIQWNIDNINNATMYGNIDWAGEYGKALGQTFFSARGLVSGPQFFGDMVRAAKSGDRVARKTAARRFAGYVGSSLLTLTAAATAGYVLNKKGVPQRVRAELDPYSSSFGEVRVGPAKINPWGTEVTLVRAAIQAAAGKRTPEGSMHPLSVSRNDIVADTLRYKASPAAGVFADIFLRGGKDVQHRTIIDRPLQYAGEQIPPIFWKDVAESLREQGWWGLATLPQAFGADIQVYDPTERQAHITELEKAGFTVIRDELGTTIRVPQLAKDWKSPKWHALFAEDFPELGDTTRFGYVNDLSDAYVDYWWKEKGDPRGIGEKARRSELREAFGKHNSISKWRDNEKMERLAEWKRNPERLLEIIKSGLDPQMSNEEEEILQEAGLID